MSSVVYIFVRLRVCCQNLQLTTMLEANASYVCSCHARLQRSTRGLSHEV